MYQEIIDTVGLVDSTKQDFITDSLAQMLTMLDSPATIKSVVSEAIHSAMSSEFFQGGALLALLAAVGYQLKAIPLSIWHRFVRAIKYTVYIDNTNDIYDLYTQWLMVRHPSKFKNVIVELKNGSKSIDKFKRYTLEVKQANDWNWFIYKGSLIISTKSRERLENASDTYSRYIDSYTLYSFFSKRGLDLMLEEVRLIKVNSGDDDNTVYYNGYHGRWEDLELHNIKTFDNIFIDNKDELINDLVSFRKNKDHYNKLGINSKRGYCFHGAPGNGKTTMALAMSRYLGMDLYIVNLKSVASDKEFASLVSSINKDSIILFEDIDTFTKDRFGEKDKTNVSFSGLLNTLNGAFEPNNCIIIMTTNHIEALDPALIRPGRIDKIIHLDNPSWACILEFLYKFYPDLNNESNDEKSMIAVNFKFDQKFPLSMSAIQNLCLSNTAPDGYKNVINELKQSLKPPTDE